MNTLISTLAKRAGCLHPFMPASQEDLERFAHAIVLHCSDIAAHTPFDMDNEIVRATCSAVSKNILNEFNRK
jgi:hypothetical protein